MDSHFEICTRISIFTEQTITAAASSLVFWTIQNGLLEESCEVTLNSTNFSIFFNNLFGPFPNIIHHNKFLRTFCLSTTNRLFFASETRPNPLSLLYRLPIILQLWNKKRMLFDSSSGLAPAIHFQHYVRFAHLHGASLKIN